MTPTPVRDLMVGIFVLAGLGALAYLSLSLGGLSYRGSDQIRLRATFDEIGGLGPRSAVVIGGVRVGHVESITLDEDFRPRVVLAVDRKLKLPEDSSASILTQGVLGDQYISLEPGGSENLLRPGDEITYTQNAVVLERLLGRVVQTLGAE